MADEALRLVIVDDEAPARWRLRALLGELPDSGAEVVGEAANADQALAALRAAPADAPVDALLLDIGLPGRDGLKLAAALRALAQPPAVVFVTAHAGHALTAFELDATDYLTKPVRRERLAEALQRLHQRRARRAGSAVAEGPALVVQDRGRLLRVPHDEVLYLKAEQKYVTLRTAQHAYVLDGSLAELESRLGAGFLRIHRNALVARRAIRALALRPAGEAAGSEGGDGTEGWAVQVAPLDEWLAVSRRQLAAVRAALADAEPR
ncbi:MAG: response regulator transcription factor [Rubrivivax sp.]|nr:response regulator transcription factor [Rubrivivax sp.]